MSGHIITREEAARVLGVTPKRLHHVLNSTFLSNNLTDVLKHLDLPYEEAPAVSYPPRQLIEDLIKAYMEHHGSKPFGYKRFLIFVRMGNGATTMPSDDEAFAKEYNVSFSKFAKDLEAVCKTKKIQDILNIENNHSRVSAPSDES